MTIINDWDLRLDVDAVLRGQGADPAILRSRNPRLVQIAAQALEEGLLQVKPKVLFETFKIESVSHTLVKMAGGKRLKGDGLGQHLAQASELTAIICTIGDELEQYAAKVMETQVVQGLALYGVGSAAVEALANAACRFLELEAEARGMQSTIPLSPGMIGWPVDQGQPQIFSLLDGSQIGVQLSEGMFMLPLKSLSMVMGFGVDLEQQGIVCDYCDIRAVCKYRVSYEESHG
jgi:hypothetical protein